MGVRAMPEEREQQQRPLTATNRLGSSLLRRRWPEFTVEFILIIVGILTALTLDGLVQDRKDREIETTYLELLRDDLAQIETELAHFVEFEKSMLTTGKAFLDAVSTADPSSGDRPLHGMLGELSIRRTLTVDSAAYTDLTSTGNLQLIANQDLRRKIVRYFADTERSELIMEKNSKEYVDGIFVRFLMDSGVSIKPDQSALATILNANTVLLDALGPDYSWPRDVVLQQPPNSSSWDDFRRQVLFRMRIAASGQVTGERVSESTRQLRFRIEEELERRDTG
jgi:hypothetical protein